jgi:hypothetical protein
MYQQHAMMCPMSMRMRKSTKRFSAVRIGSR